jgi:putative membrane protein
VGICLIGGWLIEAAGVHSQRIFGAYSYGETLGLKVLEVPLIIGVNWFLLSYCFLCCTNFISDTVKRSFVVAISMTLFDLIMEPSAIELGYWTWHCPGIPTQNYIAWFLFSWFFAYTGLSLKVEYQNKLAMVVISCLTAFFILLDIILFA